ncbi:alpha/beta hydrolase-fold protein [Actinomadura parmotrematis]|uniref:Acyl-CoA:diacylglycerol acyltransferase n=1 Tax=Actinomadura parmotrematis TaxID=2864039 RepID=A0ABS7G1F2_9ACTN|nr:alpha/beta hydrolase-fold protein [Actinomadura parmotrematis]MBW8486045.1 hypothetical protein [Actinomadura parmotrematis]
MAGATRRRILIAGLGGLGAAGVAGAAGAALVEAGTLPGKVRLDRALGRCGDRPPVPAETADVRTVPFRSDARRIDTAFTLVTPKGHAVKGLPVVLMLPGLGGDSRALLGIYADRYLAQAVAHGMPPFALVGVDGGSVYWHKRATGDDPQRMVTGEVLPRLRRLGLRTDRIGLTGWSMGGYGALLLAGTLGPRRVAAVAASSPALFGSYAKAHAANPGSYDGPADFAAHDVLARLASLAGVPTWIDCGTGDPFAPMVEKARSGLAERPAGGMFGGCHDAAYWMRRSPARVAFLGRHLP